MNVKWLVTGVTIGFCAIAGFALMVPNVLWLDHSTVRVENVGDKPISEIEFDLGGEIVQFQDIEPGAIAMGTLPNAQAGTLAILVKPNYSTKNTCQSYLENRLFHVDVVVDNGEITHCDASVPILSNLWVLKAISWGKS
jgi:hypothetical protein